MLDKSQSMINAGLPRSIIGAIHLIDKLSKSCQKETVPSVCYYLNWNVSPCTSVGILYSYEFKFCNIQEIIGDEMFN